LNKEIKERKRKNRRRKRIRGGRDVKKEKVKVSTKLNSWS
jgi:hypothetical protein